MRVSGCRGNKYRLLVRQKNKTDRTFRIKNMGDGGCFMLHTALPNASL